MKMKLNCDLKKQSSSVYTINQTEISKIEEEIQALKDLDINARKISTITITF